MLQGGTLHVHDAGLCRHIRCDGPVQVKDLLQAEAAFVSPGHKQRLCQDGSVMQPGDYLHFGPSREYQLVTSVKQQAKPAATTRGCPQASVAPSLQASGDRYTTCCPTKFGCTEVELYCGLQMLQRSHAQSHDVFVPPLEADAMSRLLKVCLQSTLAAAFANGGRVLLPVLHQDHWALVVASVEHSDGLKVRLFDGVPERCTATGLDLARTLGEGLQLEWTFEEHSWWLQRDAFRCGAHVLAHARALLTGRVDAACVDQAQAFLQTLSGLGGSLFGKGGLTEQQDAALQKVLLARGVPQAVVEEQGRQAVQKIGAGPISQALQGKNVWQLLKAAANRPGLSFRWVTPEELQLHIEARSDQKFGTNVAKAKDKKQRVSAAQKVPVQIDRVSSCWPAEASSPPRAARLPHTLLQGCSRRPLVSVSLRHSRRLLS